MNISLSPHFEQFVNNKVDTGVYHSADEVLCDALQLLEAHEKKRLAELKREIQIGIDSGISTPLNIDEIKTRGRERLAMQKAAQS